MDSNQKILHDYMDKHPISAAHVLEKLPSEAVATFLNSLPLSKCLELLSYLNSSKAANFLILLPASKIREITEKCDVTLLSNILRTLDNILQLKLLTNMTLGKSELVKSKLKQQPNTVGSLMLPAVVANLNMTVKNAVQLIKNNKENLDFYLYTVDLEGVLHGAVKIEELLVAEESAIVNELMITSIPKLLQDTPIKSIVKNPAWFEYRHLPVIDESQKLVGSLPYQSTKDAAYNEDGLAAEEIVKTGSALGELYLIGLAGMLHSASK